MQHAKDTGRYQGKVRERMNETIVSMRGICKSFPGVKALDNVHFELRSGEVMALLGENGAGKSTLMKILSGVYTRDSGSVEIFGKEYGDLTPKQAQALRDDRLDDFLKLVIESGESSWKLLQNVVASESQQSLAIALELSRRMLSECGGAWRVHGGGFAGTILAFVPQEKMAEYRARMDAVFGEGACVPLQIRPVGAVEVKL